ncbi:DUF2931 family protein [Vibrio sp. SCSIO 43135]|nr:DUF2931 family protein [Vibrio sp. SCSIO 43135]
MVAKLIACVFVYYLFASGLAFAFSKTPGTPVDMPNWRIGYAMSSLYPAKVTRAYGVNVDAGWTSYVHNDMHFLSRTEFDKIKESTPSYDGVGLALGVPVTNKRQVSGTNVLPDTIYIEWASISNRRFFTTKWTLSKELKQLMSSKETYTRWDGFETTCYRTDIIFGFLPNGNTKIWLRGCGEYRYITEIEADVELQADTFGNDASIYRENYGDLIYKRAQELDVPITPIPWDKVSKVYANEEFIKVN